MDIRAGYAGCTVAKLTNVHTADDPNVSVCGHPRVGNTVSTFRIMVTRRQRLHRSTKKNGHTIINAAFCLWRHIALLSAIVTERLGHIKETAVRPPFSSAHGRKPLPYPQLLLIFTPLPSSLHWHGRCSRLRHSGIRWRIPTTSCSPSCTTTSDSYECDSGQ